jgi:hypothetical protein
MDPLSVASTLAVIPLITQVVTAIGGITRRFSNLATYREHETSVLLNLVGDTEEILRKIEVAALPDHPVPQKLEYLLGQARITCQNINDTWREAGKRAGLTGEFRRASMRVDELGLR